VSYDGSLPHRWQSSVNPDNGRASGELSAEAPRPEHT
jgi:hypothetical protein